MSLDNSLKQQIQQYRSVVRCSFCLNTMNQSKDINLKQFKNKILPIGNKIQANGVLCNDCNKKKYQPKTAIHIEDNKIIYIDADELKDSEESKPKKPNKSKE